LESSMPLLRIPMWSWASIPQWVAFGSVLYWCNHGMPCDELYEEEEEIDDGSPYFELMSPGGQSWTISDAWPC
jgi:hypothetical protein